MGQLPTKSGEFHAKVSEKKMKVNALMTLPSDKDKDADTRHSLMSVYSIFII